MAAEQLSLETSEAEAKLSSPDAWKLTIQGAAKWAAMNQDQDVDQDDQDQGGSDE
ncbi:hypothetical protein [Lysobacter sp. A421]